LDGADIFPASPAWINNCVGYFNHRYFVLFLFWLGSGCAYVALMALPVTSQNFAKVCLSLFESFFFSLCGCLTFAWQIQQVDADLAVELMRGRTNVLFAFVLTVALGGALLGYCAWHMYLIFSQQTTIEFYLNRVAKRTGRVCILSLCVLLFSLR
jgi:palmitoyltransferase